MIHPLLKLRLEDVADRRRRLRWWCKLAVCWAGAAFLGLLLILIQRQGGWTSWLGLPLVAMLGITTALLLVRQRKPNADHREIARMIEARYPELDGRLLTAVQQQPAQGSQFAYLQERVVQEALRHSQEKQWLEIIPESRLATAQLAHWVAFALFGMALWGLRTTGGETLLARAPARERITVTPGDTSVERGNSLVVLARFVGQLPPTVDLVIGETPQTARRIPLNKSLADPMFGGSVPEVLSNFVYHVEYSGGRTRDFKVTVFDYPRLERADVALVFPEYTKEAPKRIENTRRLSAVEGSQLDLTLQFNKPVVSAQLVSKNKDKSTVPLAIETNRPLAHLTQFALSISKTYDLQLVDSDGRTNKVPAQFVFDVLKNRAPELKLSSPRGDLRPSPLEEISFEGTAWDDFGVQAYGIGYALAGQDPQFLELGRAVPAKEKQSFHHLLSLEDFAVQQDQLMSWFVWADDIGPDGQLRRTTGDLYFAEIRPFDEIFREGQGMSTQSQEGGGGGQQRSQSARLAELQKQIISATWKLNKEHGSSSPAKEGTGNNQQNPALESKPLAPRSSEFRNSRTLSAGIRFIAAVHVDGTPGSSLRQVAGQAGGERSATPPRPPGNRRGRETAPAKTATPKYADDATVVLESQAQALEQAQAALERQQDPRTATLWRAAIRDMEKAIANLKRATNSPSQLREALAAEQAAYQSLLKLQEHEYQVSRGRQQNGQGGGGNQQMQRQLEQMELTQTENRYETQRQAQRPQGTERGEDLQISSRLQELARRQQDLNERLKELQTALQEARTEQERAELQRRLKRLQEEQQQMVADLDEVRQRMERPENQSRMSDERQQLDQTRNDMQRAAEAASQGSPSQALASGAHAQSQLQQLREQMRKENSSQFADDLRDMRNQARELSRQQEDIVNKLQNETTRERRSLSDSADRKQMLDQLGRQKEQITNLVSRATDMTQEAEGSEPLLSRELYDTVRKFSQDSAREVKDMQDQLLTRGLMTRSLLDRLKEGSEQDGSKLLDITSEMLRQEFLPQAIDSGQRARGGIEDLRRGIERAANSVLGDDTEALRLAQQQLNELTQQLNQEMAAAEAGSGSTNGMRNQGTQSGNGADTNNLPANAGRRGQQATQRSARTAQAGAQNEQRLQGGNQANDASSMPPDPQSSGEQASSPREGSRDANQAGQGAQEATNSQNGGNGQTQTAQANQENAGSSRGTQRSGPRTGNRANPASGGGGEGGDASGSLGSALDRLFSGDNGGQAGPITGEDFAPWSDRLRDVEEMIEIPGLRNEVATARERVRQMRQEFKRERKKPDWAVVKLQVMKPLTEVRDRIADELARRESREALVPIDRDPVPNRYSDSVRRYYEELGKDK